MTGTTAPPERSNAAAAAGWALGFVLAGWALAIGAVLLWYEVAYDEGPVRDCSAVLSCLTPLQTAMFWVMYTLPAAVGGWLVASLLVLVAQLSRWMRSWHPALLGALMAFLVLAVAGVVVVRFLVDQYLRLR